MKNTLQKNVFKATAVLSALAMAVVALPLTVKADTTNSVINVDVVGAITTFTTSTPVTLGAITPNATGRQSINNDTVTVGTNDPDGYTLTLMDADGDNDLVSGANSFTPGSGTPAAPATLVNNTWGWRVDGLAAFGAGPTADLNSAAPSALTFAAIPDNGSAFEIASSAGTGNEATDVWYSARADDTQAPGTYTDTVTYTATTN